MTKATSTRAMQGPNHITTHLQRHLTTGLVLVVALCALLASSSHLNNNNNGRRQSSSAFAARRAADDSRPLVRLPSRNGAGSGSSNPFDVAESQESPVVMGKFKAPAPERIQRQRVPKSSQFASHTMSASYQVSDVGSTPEKVVHGITGASTNSNTQNQSKQRVVGAKIQVSDEGLNYPPSKLSADIYGNVAEIVTAPPEAVDNDFLLPSSHRFTTNGRNRP